MKKKQINPSELYRLYITENKRQEEVAKILNCSRSKISSEIKKLKIKKTKEQVHVLKKESYVKKYGVDSPTKSSAVQDKIIKTNIERYGKRRPTQNLEIRKKVEDTNIKRYGFKDPLSNPEVQDKIKKTNLKKYGVENPFQSEEIQDKIKATTLKRYGVENPSQSDLVKERKRKTTFGNFGVEHSFESKEVQDKIAKTNIKRYGHSNPMKNSKISERSLQGLIDSGSATLHFGKTIPDWSKEYNVPETALYQKVKNSYNIKEVDFFSFINNYSRKLTDIENIVSASLGIDKWDKKFSDKLKYRPDFKISDSTALNIDGLYWHSEKNLDRRYHFKMREEYESLGFRVLQFRSDKVLDPVKLEIIKSIINNASNKTFEKVGARKTNIVWPTREEAMLFLNNNHLKGHKDAKHVGLSYNGELIAIMSFINKGGVLKIERFCSRKNYSVMGGFSKLFKNILNTTTANKVYYWVDLKYGTGKFLLNHDFCHEKDILSWEWTDGASTYNRLRCRANMNGGSLTQAEQAKELGWYKIYDAGQRLYVRSLKV
jgi:hypothetical protein